MNEIVKYENQFNSIALRKFTSVDFNFLMFLSYKLREEDSNIINLTFYEIQKATKYTQKDNKDFIKDLLEMNSKLLACQFMYKDTRKIIQFVLFSIFEIDKEKQILTVQVNAPFKFLLNQLDKKFTRFELNEFLNLKSSYVKECYRCLKQFKSSGVWLVNIDEFRRLLDIPISYRMCDIDKWVLNPIEKELHSIFTNLKIEKIKKRGRGRGGIVDKLKFTFTPETIENIKDNNLPIEEQEDISYKTNQNNVKQKQLKKHSFNNFTGRIRTSEEYLELERQLLK